MRTVLVCAERTALAPVVEASPAKGGKMKRAARADTPEKDGKEGKEGKKAKFK